MKRLATTTLLFASVVFLVATGCWESQTIQRDSGGTLRQVQPMLDLVAQHHPPVADLPIPTRFALDEGKSRDYAFSGARFVDHVYAGDAEKLAVKRFYESQMPAYRWVISTSMFVRGEIFMDFEKETERCRITITDGSLMNKTLIKAQLWTSGRLETPGSQ